MTPRGASTDEADLGEELPRVYVTRALVTVLLERAEQREPEEANVVLESTPAGTFDEPLELAPETPVLTHFYLPEAGGSVRAVFGVDLGTPAGRARARFVSHPGGPLALTETDDLAAVVLVAVPPWEEASLAAFDRSGRRLSLSVIDADPPEETVA